MKGTVNGKSLDQVLSELKAPFPEEELKKNEKNETYIPVESLESRLNSVIGVLNYDTLVTYEGIQEVLGRFVVVAKTILIIYDDERNALIRKSALGGSNIIVVKDTGKPSSLKTDIAAAQSESFKNVCKLLQIGISQIRSGKQRRGQNGTKQRREEKNLYKNYSKKEEKNIIFMENKIRKAIIPAAGLGTRFLPATKAQPKEMLPIVDKPTLQYIIEECVESGIEEILIITGRNKKSIEDHFDRSVELEMELEKSGKEEMLKMVREISDMVNIHFIRQKEPRGLGHAILCAKTFVGNEPFAVLLGDDVVYNDNKPCLKQLIDCYEEYKTSVLGVQTVEPQDVNKYGIVGGLHIEDRVYKVKNLIEKPAVEEAPSNVAILGRYIITPKIFEILENTKPGKGNEIQLTDALLELIKHEAMYAYDFEGRRYDVGDKLGFLQATVEYALRKKELRDGFIEYLKTII